MIRFSAFLVVVALGLLVAGVVTSKLLLVYVAIGVSGVALVALGAGALLKRRELFGQPRTAEPQLARPAPVDVRVPSQPEPHVLPWSAAVPAGPGPAAPDWSAAPSEWSASSESPAPSEWPAAPDWPAVGQARPSTAGYLPADDHESAEPEPQQPAEPSQVPEAQQAAAARQPAEPEPEPSAAEQPSEEPATPAATTSTPASTAATSKPATPTPSDVPPASLPAPELPPVDLQHEVTVVPGVPRYHNAHCILIRFMGEDDLEKMTLGAAREADCTPCRACLPDQAEVKPELALVS